MTGKKLASRLPPPESIIKIGDVVFEIYKAKNLYASRWNNNALRQLTIESRKSYYHWGDIQLLEKDDEKAVIYLIRAKFQLLSCKDADSNDLLEEWFSYRFIPGNGKKSGVKELDIFIYNNKPVMKVVQEQLFDSSKDYLNFIVNCSRLCGIIPYYKKENYLQKNQLPLKHKNTLTSFLLMNEYFIKECRQNKIAFQYLIAIIRNDFINKVLTLAINGKKFPTLWTPAYQTLNLNKNDIKINRNARSNYVYKFPAYFLNINQLIKILQKLVHEEKLSLKSIEYYLDIKINSNMKKDLKTTILQQSKKLGRLLTIENKIRFSSLTGKQIRKIIDANVNDGPELKITKFSDYAKNIQDLLLVLKK